MSNYYRDRYIEKMLELKTMELKLEIPAISINDVASYYLQVILKNKQVTSLSQEAYNIFNIKPNIVIEYVNTKLITNKQVTLNDFKEMFEN